MRIYIAGAISSDNVIGVLNNLAEGQKVAAEVLRQGHSPFCPHLDFLFQFHKQTLTVEDYHRYSMEWLEVSDGVLVLPRSENSKGVQAEIARARELNIPVAFLSDKLDNHMWPLDKMWGIDIQNAIERLD